jgi:hypothetical protein
VPREGLDLTYHLVSAGAIGQPAWAANVAWHPHHISVRMFDALLWVALTVLILGLTLYVLLENSNKEDRRQRKRLRSGAAS